MPSYGNPKSRDNITAIELYGKVYEPVNEVVTIPTVHGDMLVTLKKPAKRKDWFYDMSWCGKHFIMVDFDSMVEAIMAIIPESDIL